MNDTFCLEVLAFLLLFCLFYKSDILNDKKLDYNNKYRLNYYLNI